MGQQMGNAWIFYDALRLFDQPPSVTRFLDDQGGQLTRGFTIYDIRTRAGSDSRDVIACTSRSTGTLSPDYRMKGGQANHGKEKKDDKEKHWQTQAAWRQKV